MSAVIAVTGFLSGLSVGYGGADGRWGMRQEARRRPECTKYRRAWRTRFTDVCFGSNPVVVGVDAQIQRY